MEFIGILTNNVFINVGINLTQIFCTELAVADNNITFCKEQLYISNQFCFLSRGIKYAESPTGQRRFRPVAPFSDTWSGIKSAQVKTNYTLHRYMEWK